MGRHSRCYQLISRPVDGDVARAPAPHSYSPGIEILTATGAGLPGCRTDRRTEHRHSGSRDQQRNIGSTEASGGETLVLENCQDKEANVVTPIDLDLSVIQEQYQFRFMSLVRVGRHQI